MIGALAAAAVMAQDRMELPGPGPHIVLLAGDEEYRSEEALPQLAKILSQRHGFRCTVLFSLDKEGFIDPDEQQDQPGLESLETADLVVMMLRFRRWPEEQMRHFDDYYRSGKPILAIRTSTHAFAHESGPFERYGWRSKIWPGGFGKQVLGETWISHWGSHGTEATRGVTESGAENHPILRGVKDVFGPTDVYEVHPPADAEILMRGQVLAGMEPNSGPSERMKGDQPINEPMMPILWTRGKVVTTTMGSAQDLANEGFRRLLVNSCLWLTDQPISASANVDLVGEYQPSAFGFGGFRKGIRPADLID